MLHCWQRARGGVGVVGGGGGSMVAAAAAAHCPAHASFTALRAATAALPTVTSCAHYSTTKVRSPFAYRGGRAAESFSVREESGVKRPKRRHAGARLPKGQEHLEGRYRPKYEQPPPRENRSSPASASRRNNDRDAAAADEVVDDAVEEGEFTAAGEGEEGPDPGLESKRRVRVKKPKHVYREPTLDDAAHPDSAFFKPLSSAANAKKKQATEAEAEGASEEAVDLDAADRFLRMTKLSYDPTRFVDATTFRELKVASHVHTKLEGAFDIVQPTPIQRHAIPFLLHAPFFTERLRGPAARLNLNPSRATEADRAGVERRRRAALSATPRDLVVQDMTGSGKTLSYVLPLLSLVDNFSRHTQGVVVAPTRELAVQIFRVLTRLNTSSSSTKRSPTKSRRRRNPVTIELAVGTVNEEYAASVRRNRPHIVVGTPAAIQALVLPPLPPVPDFQRPAPGSGGSGAVKGGFGALSLAHLRLLVLDEIDHLMLPFTARGMERLLQFYTGSRTHGSVRRTGRIVCVSAAITERVHRLGSKWFHRPVTATSDGLLDGWVDERRRLRDKFHLQTPEEAEAEKKRAAAEAEAAATERAALMDALARGEDLPAAEAEVEEAEEEEDLDEEQELAASFQTDDSIHPLPRAPVDLRTVASELHESYEEADLVLDEAEDEEAEAMAIRAMKEADGEGPAADQLDPEETEFEAAMRERDQQQQQQQHQKARANVIRAEDFRLPGVEENDVPVDAAALSLGAAAAASAPFSPVSESDPGLVEPEASLPLASDHAIRFLPPTMNHVVVHVPAASKLTFFQAHDADKLSESEQRRALQDKVNMLSRLHATLKPRVALVFFSSSREAVEIAAELKKQKGIRAGLLVSNARLTVKQRIHAMRYALWGRASFLFATDLASRGLDIQGLSHVINFDPPKTALDYVHRAGRVERLGGKTGCTVVTVVKDHRLEPAAAQNKRDAASAASRRPSTFIGPQIRLMERLAAQLHIQPRRVVIKSGALEDFVAPNRAAAAAEQTANQASPNQTNDDETDQNATDDQADHDQATEEVASSTSSPA